VASPVMTEACAQAAKRMISFQEQLVENGVKPATVSELMSSGVMVGEKRPIFTKLLTAATIIFPNSLLASTGMLTANALSAATQLGLRSTRESIKGVAKGVKNKDFTDLRAHWAANGMLAKDTGQALLRVATLGLYAGSGNDARVYRNAARFFWSTFMEGRASDLHFNVEAIAREQGMTKGNVIEKAKGLLWSRFLDQNPDLKNNPDFDSIKKSFFESFKGEDLIEIDQAAQDLFSTTYDYAPKHAIFHDPGKQTKIPIAKAIDFVLTTPSRLAVGIDETAKVFFRNQIISEEIYKDAIKANYQDPSKSVARYYQEYSQELYGSFKNAYNQVPKGAFKNRYHNITKGMRVLEGKFDKMFLERSVSFNDIREEALQMTFQRQTSGFKKDSEGNYIVDEQGEFKREPSIIDRLARSKTLIKPQDSTINKAFAVVASGTMPFVKTPYNILIEGLTYTPVFTPLLFPKTVREKLKMRGYSTDDLLARQVMAYSAGAALALWMSEDDGTGMPKISGIPVSYQERERWKLSGIPESSIRVGDVWVPYNRIEPVALFFGAMAQARYHLINGDEEGYWDAMTSIWKLTGDKQAFSGIIDFIDNFAYGNPERGFDNALNDYIKSYIPTISSDIARVGDEDRVALTRSEKMQQRIPGKRQELPVDYSSIAEADQIRKGWEIFLKMNFPDASWTDLQKEIHNTKADISKPNRIFRNVELNSKELSILRKVSQDAVTHGLSWVITTDAYQSMGPKRRGAVLMEQTNHIRSSPSFFAAFIAEASKPENYGPNYSVGFAKRAYNAKAIRARAEDEVELYEEPEYAPTAK
jgi:hypothetical protein